MTWVFYRENVVPALTKIMRKYYEKDSKLLPTLSK